MKSRPKKTEKKSGGSSKLSLFLKIAFVAVIFWFMFKKGLISVGETAHAFSQWRIIVPTLLVLSVCNAVIGVYRWAWLLEAQGVRLKWTKILNLTFIGYFFNIALPGAISGDVVKAYYVGKEASGKGTRALGSILFDRVTGVSGMALSSAGALLLGSKAFWGTPFYQAIQVFVFSSAIGVILFFTYLFLITERHDPLLRLFRACEKKLPKLKAITQIYESIRHYHNHRWTVVKALLLSMMIQICIGWVVAQYAVTLGETGLNQLAIYVIVPLGVLVTAIPILPGGVGTGHAAFFALFKLIGCSRGADIFSMYVLVQIAFGLVGGLFYLPYKAAGAAPVLSSA